MDKILVTVFGLAGMVFTYWFFLMKKDEEIKVSGSIDIIVDGGYTPPPLFLSRKIKSPNLIFCEKIRQVAWKK